MTRETPSPDGSTHDLIWVLVARLLNGILSWSAKVSGRSAVEKTRPPTGTSGRNNCGQTPWSRWMPTDHAGGTVTPRKRDRGSAALPKAQQGVPLATARRSPVALRSAMDRAAVLPLRRKGGCHLHQPLGL